MRLAFPALVCMFKTIEGKVTEYLCYYKESRGNIGDTIYCMCRDWLTESDEALGD